MIQSSISRAWCIQIIFLKHNYTNMVSRTSKMLIFIYFFSFILENRNKYYLILAEGPGDAHGKKWKNRKKLLKFLKKVNFLAYNTPLPPISVHKNFSPIGPAVWPAICIYIYKNVLFYYIYNVACFQSYHQPIHKGLFVYNKLALRFSVWQIRLSY